MDTKRTEQIINAPQREPGSLIQILLDIQNEIHWLPREALPD
jgi:NADH:ubiquinone oxidoreductase subunit E